MIAAQTMIAFGKLYRQSYHRCPKGIITHEVLIDKCLTAFAVFSYFDMQIIGNSIKNSIFVYTKGYLL